MTGTCKKDTEKDNNTYTMYSLIWKKHTTESRGKNCIGACETVMVPEKCIILVKGMYRQCETVVRCAAGTSEPFAVEVGLHQGATFSPFLFAIMMVSLTENIRKEAPWQMMFADDVVLCAREKDVLELEPEQWM